MSPFSLFVTFLLIWWMTLFIILPLGIKGQAESGDIVEGSEPGAPVNSNILAKFKLTTIVASLIWLVVSSVIWSGAISWDQIASLLVKN